MAPDKKQLAAEFHDYVNMSVKELEKWLEDPKSAESGAAADNGDKAKGPKSGQKTLELLKKREGEWDEEDYQHVRHVVNYCKSHVKSAGSKKEGEDSNWRHALMNWGHDPLKTKRERSRSPAKSPAAAKGGAKATPERKTPEKAAEKQPPAAASAAAENGASRKSPQRAPTPTKAKASPAPAGKKEAK